MISDPHRRRMWSRAVLLKYWSMQLPAIVITLVIAAAIAQHFDWPHWVVAAAVAAWVVKDGLLYFLVWRAYDPDYPIPFPYRMEGATGVAVDRIEGTGTVRVWGEFWRAELPPHGRHIAVGQKVRVTARRGLTLVVEAVDA
ncbi:MAG: NfeD family protein [Betaproteobacteria bacterium]